MYQPGERRLAVYLRAEPHTWNAERCAWWADLQLALVCYCRGGVDRFEARPLSAARSAAVLPRWSSAQTRNRTFLKLVEALKHSTCSGFEFKHEEPQLSNRNWPIRHDCRAFRARIARLSGAHPLQLWPEHQSNDTACHVCSHSKFCSLHEICCQHVL